MGRSRSSKESLRLKRKRKRMFNENRFCIFCAQEMILPEDLPVERMVNKDGEEVFNHVVQANMCTLEHLYPKGHDYRLTPIHGNEVRVIICCFNCNQKRNFHFRRKLKLNLRSPFYYNLRNQQLFPNYSNYCI